MTSVPGHQCKLLVEVDPILKRFPTPTPLNLIARVYFRAILVSDHVKHIREIFMSTAGIRREKERQLTTYKHKIHPLSCLHLVWLFVMLLITLQSMLWSPYHRALYVTEGQTELWAYNALVSFQVFSLLNLLLNFMVIGYYDEDTERVTFHARTIARRYLTGLFPMHAFAMFNPTIFHIFGLPRGIPIIVSTIRLVQYARLVCVVSYMNRLQTIFRCPLPIYTLIKLLAVIILHIHWLCTVMMYNRVTNPNTNVTSFSPNSWLNIVDAENDPWIKVYFLALRRVVYITFNVSTNSAPQTLEDTFLFYVSAVMGIALRIYIVLNIMRVVKCGKPVRLTYNEICNQVNAYMSYKGLPKDLQRRVNHFLMYRLQKTYFNEREIFSFINKLLATEVILHNYQKTLKNVPMFDSLPTSAVLKVIASMKLNIYLPSDVIAAAGSVADRMHIITNGTVAMYDATGREMGHLTEGEFFGTVPLSVQQRRRLASAVAAETCAVYSITYEDLMKVMVSYPDQLNKIMGIEVERYQATMDMMLYGPDF